MNAFNRNLGFTQQETTMPLARTYLAGVFMWMFLAMALTAATAWLFASSPNLMTMLINPETGSMSIAGWIAIFNECRLQQWF